MNSGFVSNTTPPVPVEAAVEPVPPLEVGRVPNVKPKTPDELIVALVDPLTKRNPPDGTLTPTDVTVPNPIPPPEPGGVCHDRLPAPFVVRTWPLVPEVRG